MSNKMTKIAKGGIVAAMLLAPLVSLAVFSVPPDPGVGGAWTLDRIENFIERIGNFMVTIGIIIAVIFIIYGGIKYMVARGDPKAAEEARTAILNGVIGAAVVLGVGIVIRTAAGLITGSFFG